MIYPVPQDHYPRTLTSFQSLINRPVLYLIIIEDGSNNNSIFCLRREKFETFFLKDVSNLRSYDFWARP